MIENINYEEYYILVGPMNEEGEKMYWNNNKGWVNDIHNSDKYGSKILNGMYPLGTVGYIMIYNRKKTYFNLLPR